MSGMEIYSLRQLIREGRYEVQPELVAEAIVRSWTAESELFSARTSSPDREAEQLHFEGFSGEPVTPTNHGPGPSGVYGRQLPPPSPQP